MGATVRLPVRATTGTYDVLIGPDLLAHAGSFVREVTSARTLALVTDATVHTLRGSVVAEALRGAGFHVLEIVIPPGESSKSWGQAGQVVERLADTGLDRRDAVVALGGGVVGDLGGFCASVYLRGIDYIQMPTTLLAQVDSSVGGKTGVDLTAGKNLAGAFKQPLLVLADTGVLATLPGVEWSSGLAEVVKTAMLDSTDRVTWLVDHAAALLGRHDEAVTEMVAATLRHKAAVVAADEREAGERESLNFGHTLGHAIERVAGYGAVPHGLAVAEGMRYAAILGEVAAGAPESTTRQLTAMLNALDIARPAYPHDVSALVSAMHADKKARSGTVRFVFVPEPGHHIVMPVDDTLIGQALESFFDRDQK